MENGKDRRLDQLLGSYGADRTRWPEAERGMFASGSGSPEADARAIDALLVLASMPGIPEGAISRLLDRLAREAGADVVLLNPRAPTPRSFFRIAAALPLAASLALGVYLGAQGSLDFMLPASLTGDVAQNDDAPDDLGGVGEADAYAEENFT